MPSFVSRLLPNGFAFVPVPKRLGLVLLTIAAGFALSACDSFLDRSPKDAVTPDTYFQSEQELETYVNGLYSYVPGSEIYNEDFTSDNVVQKTPNLVAAGKHTVPQTGGGWTWDYLREVNFFLANYRSGPVSAEAARPYAGVARFFRAWFYFDKVKRFGRVPWYSKPLEPGDEGLYKARNERQAVMDSVLADLNYAVETVPTTAPLGKIDRGAALALKARVCLHEGTYRRYHDLDGSQRWLEAAAQAARRVIEGGRFSLYSTGNPATDYRDLFARESASPDEVILPQIYNQSLSKTHPGNYTFLSTTYGNPGYTKAFVNTYLNADGTSFATRAGRDTLGFYEEMQGRDPRLAQTIRTPGYSRIGRSEPLVPNFDNARSGYQNIKFVMEPAFDSFDSNVNDLPVIRYAEVLLTYAEAKAELGTLTQSDLDRSINRLRERAGMPPMTLGSLPAHPILKERYPEVTGAQADAVLEIRRERRVELAMEGFRYDDLMRWKAGPLMAETSEGIYLPGLGTHDLDRDGDPDLAVVESEPDNKQSGVQYLEVGNVIGLTQGRKGNVVPHPDLSKVFEAPKHYTFPIPTDQLTLNDSLEQNPGW
jgi:hypothetical protein